MRRNDFNVLKYGFVTISILATLLGCSLVVVFILKNYVSFEKNEGIAHPHEFRIFEFDQETKLSSRGFVSFYDNEELVEVINNFGKYDLHVGKHTLISNFEDEEFYCVGSCSCEGGRRSSSTSTMKRGAFLLVAAATSLVAYNYAREQFKDQCLEKMTSICPENSLISSEIDSCATLSTTDEDSKNKKWKPIEYTQEDFDTDEDEEGYQEATPDMNVLHGTYWCKGRCSFNFDQSLKLVQEINIEFGHHKICDEFTMKSKVEVREKDLYEYLSPEKNQNNRGIRTHHPRTVARKKFYRVYLVPHCVEQGLELQFERDEIWEILDRNHGLPICIAERKEGLFCIEEAMGKKTGVEAIDWENF